MYEAKNTARAVVHIGYDGRVHKYFKGPQALERYENEKRVLSFLQERDCPFVPRLLQNDDEQL
ncbi:MAG: serine/threonine protein phosphatase, partial [Opitutales bacterium]